LNPNQGYKKFVVKLKQRYNVSRGEYQSLRTQILEDATGVANFESDMADGFVLSAVHCEQG